MLVVTVADAPPPPRRRLGRAKPKDADPEAAATRVPVTTLTAIRSQSFAGEAEARAWLAGLRDDPEAVAAEIAEALILINLAVHAHRAAAL
ncbi:MAG TPA: hypothetical protein VID76_08925, partial [Solirubrobacterales bacterium]